MHRRCPYVWSLPCIPVNLTAAPLGRASVRPRPGLHRDARPEPSAESCAADSAVHIAGGTTRSSRERLTSRSQLTQEILPGLKSSSDAAAAPPAATGPAGQTRFPRHQLRQLGGGRRSCRTSAVRLASLSGSRENRLRYKLASALRRSTNSGASHVASRPATKVLASGTGARPSSPSSCDGKQRSGGIPLTHIDATGRCIKNSIGSSAPDPIDGGNCDRKTSWTPSRRTSGLGVRRTTPRPGCIH